MSGLLAWLILAAVVPVRVTASRVQGLEKERVEVVVDVTRTDASAPSADSASSVPRRLTFLPDSRGPLEISLDEGVFRFQARAPGYWSPPVLHRIPHDGQEVPLRLWRTAPIAIALLPDEGVATPQALEVRFRGQPQSTSETVVPPGLATCHVDTGAALCELPLGVLDLRLEATGLIPAYIWSYAVTQGRRQVMGPIRLRPGASIVGFLRTEEDGPVQGATVEVLTLSGQRLQSQPAKRAQRVSPEEVDRLRHPLQTQTNDRGFFQILGVPPGEYQVGARLGPLMAMASARVETAAETRLSDFLILEPPLELSVTVEPATAPGDTNWSLRLLRVEPFPGLIQETQLPSTGSTTLSRIGRGRYSIEVRRFSERWFVHTLTLDQPPGPLVIRLPIVQVRGELTLGGKPITGELTFGGQGGPQHIPMEADAEGQFTGSLPNGGDWRVSVSAGSPPVHRNLRRVRVDAEPGGEALVRIELPDTVLSGRVLDHRATGIEGALVNVQPQDVADHLFQVRTESDGRFALHGLAEGAVTLVAQHDRQMSDVVTARVASGTERQVALVLRNEVRVKGRVRSAGGSPVAGATLLAFPMGVPSTWSPYFKTDPWGEFELTLPPGTTEIAIRCWADGLVERLQRLAIPKGPLEITLDQAGGTLVIENGAELDLLNELNSIPVVVHRGAEFPASQIFGDALRRGVLAEIPGSFVLSTITLPQLAPGEYAVCSQSGQGVLANQPIQGPCERGTLTAGGELRLKLRAEKDSR